MNTLLKELSHLPKSIYKTLEHSLDDSEFWKLQNDDYSLNRGKTPLSSSLEGAIRGALEQSGLDIAIRVRVLKDSPIPEDTEIILAYAEHNGDYAGRETILLFLYSGDISEIENYNPKVANQQLAEVIRHELIHSYQLHRQATNKVVSLGRAERDRRKDKRQVYGGKDAEKYFSLPTEVDAFAHQIAERMLKLFGNGGALKQLSLSLSNEDISSELAQFAPLINVSNPRVLNKIRTRIFSYIQEMSKR